MTGSSLFEFGGLFPNGRWTVAGSSPASSGPPTSSLAGPGEATLQGYVGTYRCHTFVDVWLERRGVALARGERKALNRILLSASSGKSWGPPRLTDDVVLVVGRSQLPASRRRRRCRTSDQGRNHRRAIQPQLGSEPTQREAIGVLFTSHPHSLRTGFRPLSRFLR